MVIPTCPTWYGGSGILWTQVGQWIPMDSPTCPMVQWDSHLCTMDSDGRLGHPCLRVGEEERVWAPSYIRVVPRSECRPNESETLIANDVIFLQAFGVSSD